VRLAVRGKGETRAPVTFRNGNVMRIESAGLTDVGKKREGNEDSFLIDDALGFYAVADGMGGHRAGEVASRMVVEALTEHMSMFCSGREAPTLADNSLSSEALRVLAGIQAANWNIHNLATSSEDHRGMGSTVAAVYCTPLTLIAANVGDSPIYLIRDGAIKPLSVTHTVEAELSQLSAEKFNKISPRYHHMLTRAVGIEEDVYPDVCEAPYFDQDIVVICSDGLSNKVTPQELRDIVLSNPPEEACRILVGLANGRGGEDNITVIVLKLRKKHSGDSFAAQLIERFFEGWKRLFSRSNHS
jgi:protein phosphatase